MGTMTIMTYMVLLCVQWAHCCMVVGSQINVPYVHVHVWMTPGRMGTFGNACFCIESEWVEWLCLGMNDSG